MVASNSSSENIPVTFFFEQLKLMNEEIKTVGKQVGEVYTDVAVIKAKTEQVLATIEKLNNDHEKHKADVEKKLLSHEKRLGELEKKHSSTRNYVVGYIAGGIGVLVAIAFVVSLWKDISDLKKENERLLSVDEHSISKGAK